MTALFKTFASSESGAVTVDWVVLTAALVGLGLALMAVVSSGVENLGTDIRNALANTSPVTDPFTTNTNVTAGNDITLNGG
ncbi:hypothetical protein HKCCSP123_11895 [Rhodobacterales bacterium HKCCSP123]|nr:hypothetical protein [Rhodobacterales bacterium HKCCSP123]